MKEPEQTSSTDELYQQSLRDLEKVREIINAKALKDQHQKYKAEAREYVADVFSEALNDRQQKDASVSKILVPIVEESVQMSITHHRVQFIDYLYPLIGDLVRKFTTAFLRDFIEKTNEVIEKSVTFKSIGWRFNAWRAGVSYSSYVASQTYLYQVQQVLLIHQETGVLLNSVSLDGKHDENSDLVSSMLTAINDFVSDSFATQSSGDHLDEIKTENFTLYLRKGPKAVLVAAVTGNISPKAKTKLQTTLEYIHAMYLPKLDDFNGNTDDFAIVSDDLNECLLAETIDKGKKKKPIFSIIALLLISCLLVYWGWLKWQTEQTLTRIQQLPKNTGIVITSAKVNGINDISLQILRDPRAVSLEQWLASANVDSAWINTDEIPFLSLSKTLISSDIAAIVNTYPTLDYTPQTNSVSGLLSPTEKMRLLSELSQVQGIKQYPVTMRLSEFDSPSTELALQTSKHALTILSGQIMQLQVTFDLASSEITPANLEQLVLVKQKFDELRAYSIQTQQSAKLLILGTSDNIGDVNVNRKLSIERAENTKQALIVLGVDSNELLVSGLGIVDTTATNINMRKAIINVVFTPL